jgi:hypothetical protein
MAKKKKQKSKTVFVFFSFLFNSLMHGIVSSRERTLPKKMEFIIEAYMEGS